LHPVVLEFKVGQFHHQNALTLGRCLATAPPRPASVAEERAALLISKANAAAEAGLRQQYRAKVL
jgi:hypothetical protein